MKSVLQNATIEANSCQTNALLGVVNQHKDGKRKTDKFFDEIVEYFFSLNCITASKWISVELK